MNYERSVFAEFEPQVWPYKFQAVLDVEAIHGGIPDDPKVVEGWIRRMLAENDELIREAVATTMVELGVDQEQATESVIAGTSVNRFKRDEEGGLYIEGRQIKAAIKEAASVALAAGHLKGRASWGVTHKGLQSFIAEHIQVEERKAYLGVREARVVQKFVHTFRGNAVAYEEEVTGSKLSFTVSSDWDFKEDPDFWAKVWVTGQKQGIGASRSQGYGTYIVAQWEPLRT